MVSYKRLKIGSNKDGDQLSVSVEGVEFGISPLGSDRDLLQNTSLYGFG